MLMGFVTDADKLLSSTAISSVDSHLHQALHVDRAAAAAAAGY